MKYAWPVTVTFWGPASLLLSLCVLYAYLYGWLLPLYSCLRTLRERYRGQNCDNGGTTTSNSWFSDV